MALVINNNVYLIGGVVASGTLTNVLYTTPITHTFPNQYNPSWTTNWYTDSSSDFGYHLTLDGMEATNVTVADATHLTAKTPAHNPAATDVKVTTYDNNDSNVLANAYTYLPDAYAFTNDPLNVMARQPGKLMLEMRDANGNPVTSEDPITLQLSTDDATGAFATSQGGPWNLSSITVPAGQSSVDLYYKDAAKGTPTITATDPNSTKTTQKETITSPYKIVVTGITDPTNVGVPSSVTVQVVDYVGASAPDFRGVVTFTSTDGAATLPTDYTFTSADFGRHTFTNGVVFGTEGEWSVTATETDDASVTGSQENITVGPPAAGIVSQIVFLTQPQAFSVDSTSGTMTVQLEDSAGTPMVVQQDTTLYLRTDSAGGKFSVDSGATWQSGPVAVTIPANTSTISNFMYRDTQVGNYLVTVGQHANNNFGWKVAQQNVYVSTGGPEKVKLTNAVNDHIYAGQWTPITVGLSDIENNAVNAPADTPIHLSITNGGAMSMSADGTNPLNTMDVTVPAGTQYITVYVQGATGTVTITATDNRPLSGNETAYTSATANLTVLAANAYKVGLVPMNWDAQRQRGTQKVHSSQKIVVTLYDFYGNVTLSSDDTNVTLSSEINDPNQTITTVKGTNGYFGLTSTTTNNESLKATVPSGASTADVYYQQNIVAYGVTLTADAETLQDGTVQDDVQPGAYVNKLLWVNPSYSYKDVNGTTKTPTSDAQLAADPAAFAKFIASNAEYPKSLRAIAGQPQSLKVYLADQWGNPTAATSTVTLGVGGSNLAKYSDGSAKANWSTTGNSPWNPVVTTPGTYYGTDPHPVSASQTISISPVDSGSGNAAPSYASFYYKDDVAGRPNIGVLDTASSHYNTWINSAIIRTQHDNDTLNNKAINVVAAAPNSYKIITAPQTVVTRTASQPITLELLDQFGNEATNDSGVTATVSTSSTTGAFSGDGSNWSNDTLDVTFAPGTTRKDVYYKDSTVSPVGGFTITVAESSADAADTTKPTMTGTTQSLRTILGVPNKSYLDLHGVTTASAGACLPVTLIATTTVYSSGQPDQDLEAVVLANTNFALSPSSKDNGFYTADGCASGTEVTNVTMAKNTSEVSLWVRYNAAGTKSLNATATGFTSGTSNPVNQMPASLIVSPAGIYQLGFSTVPSTFVVGRNSGNIAVSTEDMFGNIVVTDTDRNVAVTSSSNIGTFTGNSSEYDTTITSGTSTTANFTYTNGTFDKYGNLENQAALGAQTLTAQTTALNTASKTITAVGTVPTSIRYLNSNGDAIGKVTLSTDNNVTVYPEFMAADGKPAILPNDISVDLDTFELSASAYFSAEHGDDIFSGPTVGSGKITIPADYASKPLIIQPRTAENHRVRSYANYIGRNGGVASTNAFLEIDVTAGAPDGLKPTGSVQTIHPQIIGDPVDGNAKSNAINIYLIDKYGNYTSSSSDTVISLASSCGTGHFLSSGSTITNSITVGAGNQSGATWYQDTSAHNTPCTMTFTSGGLINGTQDINVTERVYSLKLTPSKDTIQAGENDVVTITPLDRFGNVVIVTDQPLVVTAETTGTDSVNNVVTPSPLSIPVGSNTGAINFKHAAALTQATNYSLTVTNAAASAMSTTTDITVIPGTATKLMWTSSKYTATAGEIIPVIVQLTNQFGYAVPATENMDIGLSNTAGTNQISGKQAGAFFSDAAATQAISSAQLMQGESKTQTFYYQQTQTTQDKYQYYSSGPPVITGNGDAHPASIYASYNTLTSASAPLTINAIDLYFADTTSKVTSKSTLQARSCYALKLTASKAMPFDQTYNLGTNMNSTEGNFYQSCNTPPGLSESEMPNQRITQITIPANQTQSAVFYYHQTKLSSVGEWTWNQAKPVAQQSDNWSTNTNTLEGIKTVNGNINHIAFIKPGGSSSSTNLGALTQNQPGTYVIETRDNLDNPTPYIPGSTAGFACVYVAVDVPTGDSAGKLTTNESGNCPKVAGTIAIAMTGGETRGTFTYSSMATGTHTLRADSSSSMTSSVFGEKAIAVDVAQTDHLLFAKSSYPMVRGTNTNVTVQLAGGQWNAIVNTIGNTQVTLTSDSASGEWKDPATGNWVKSLTITIPAGQTNLTATYRDDSADLGSYTVTASADGLTPSTTQLVLTTGDFSGVAFTSQPQTLEAQQPGTFTVSTVDAGGNPVIVANDQCVYVTIPSITAIFNTENTSDTCLDLTLPGGTITHGVLIRGGESGADFTLSDKTIGQYNLTVATNPITPSQGLNGTQPLTIVSGEPVTATLEKDTYDLERGDTITTKVVLRNAYGAIVPATEDTYLKLTTSSGTGQFAVSTTDAMQSTLIVFIAKDDSTSDVLYTDTDPQISTSHVTIHHVTSSGQDIISDTLADSDTPINIVYGTPTQLAFTNDPRTTIATHPSEVMIAELQNQFGYTTVANQDLSLHIVSDSSTGDFALSKDGPWGVTTATIPAGNSSIELYYHDSTEGVHEMQVTAQLTTSDGAVDLVGDQPHTITRQALDHFEVTNISTPQQAGTPSSVVVFAEDSGGFVVQWYTGTVHFSADSDDAIYPVAEYTFTTADKGMHTFKNSIAFRQAGIKAITVTDTNGLTGTQYSIQVGNPNTNPIKSIVFIDPEEPEINLLKNTPSDSMTLQLRDAADVPTTPINTDGLPIHLTSDSPTGQFATSPTGPWSSSLDVTVQNGLSFTTTPFYYQDATGGAHTITAADWAAGIDDSAILNGTLKVNIANLTVNDNTTLYSRDYNGTLVPNYYLFSHNSQGDISGYAQSSLSALNIKTNLPEVADWTVNTVNAKGSVLNQQSFSQQTSIPYTTPTLTPIRTDGDDAITTSVTTTTGLDGIRSIALPVSPWLVTLQGANIENGTATVDFTAYNGGTVAVPPDATVAIPSTGAAWSFNSLQRNGWLTKDDAGMYRATVPVADSTPNGTQIVVTLRDTLGIIAQDASGLHGGAVVPPISQTVNPSEPPTTPTVDVPHTGGELVVPHTSGGGIMKNDSPLRRFLRLPQAPTIVSGALFGILLLVAGILLYQAYKEWQRSNRLALMVKKNNQLVADKTEFLNLAAHHLRTPVTIMRNGIELMKSLPASPAANPAATTRFAAIADGLRDRVEQIIAEVTNSPELTDIATINPHINRLKVALSPIFWMPITLSIVLTLIANWAIRLYGGRSLSATQTLNQIFFTILGVVVIYATVRLKYMRTERRRILSKAEERIDAFNTAKINFVRRVYADLSNGTIQADALLEENAQTMHPSVKHSLTSSVARLKTLNGRFALLDSVYRLAPEVKDFSIDYAVEEALYSLEVAHEDVSSLHIANKAKDMHVTQDHRLVSKVFETILASMRPAIGGSAITIDGSKDEHGATLLRFTGPGTDAPAENLFSVYSSSDNEDAGTLSEDTTTHRLDLYLDRIIITSLGGEIVASKRGGELQVNLLLPATS